MVDYVKLAATAERLIRLNGREVTFFRLSQTPTDPDKPWKGNTPRPDYIVLPAVFVPPNTVRQFGLTSLGQGTEFVDLITFSEQIAIVFPEENDLREYTTLHDVVDYNILGIQVLRPGPINMLAFVGVRR